jgi:hypothetical protein
MPIALSTLVHSLAKICCSRDYSTQKLKKKLKSRPMERAVVDEAALGV